MKRATKKKATKKLGRDGRHGTSLMEEVRTKKDLITKKEEKLKISIPRLVMKTAEFEIVGTAPYVQNMFSEKAQRIMEETQEAGSQSETKRRREPKDFEECFLGAQRISMEGWNGIHAGSFRDAMISACRVCGVKMTRAKLSIFVLADGIDNVDGAPLVRLIAGKPRMVKSPVRLASGATDIHARPFWDEWGVILRIEFDEGQFSVEDVGNLVLRAGRQVGVGEGRPDSKKSNGQGWGTFTLKE